MIKPFIQLMGNDGVHHRLIQVGNHSQGYDNITLSSSLYITLLATKHLYSTYVKSNREIFMWLLLGYSLAKWPSCDQLRRLNCDFALHVAG